MGSLIYEVLILSLSFSFLASTTARATLAKSDTADIAMLQSDLLPPLPLPPFVPLPGVLDLVRPCPYLGEEN